MRRLAMVALALGIPAGTARVLADDQPPAPGPTLVVAITVDQLRGDYLQRFGAEFSGGLARMARQGALFTNAFQDHAMTETAPGHATVLSGRNPSSTGIVRNAEGVNDSTPLLEVAGPGASPLRFRGTALFDWMRARWPAAHALSVSRKDRSAILLLGRARESVYWYEGGQFTTSRYYADSLPAWVRAFNRAAVTARAPGRAWTLLRAAGTYPEPDSVPYENRGRNVVFPHRLPADTAQLARAFYTTPWMDSLTLSLALAGVERLGLGRGPGADLLAIGLSATDYIGHAFGPNSREVHDQVLRLDRALGWFLDSLGRMRNPRRIIVVLTADHGVTAFPEWARAHGNPRAGYVDIDTLVSRWRRTLVSRAGAGTWIPYADAGLIALDRHALAARGVDVDGVIARMQGDLRRVPGIGRVDTRATLLAADTARDAIARRWRNVLTPDSRAELFVTPETGVVFGAPGGSANHGLPSDDDASVALVFWGAGIRPGTHASRVSVTDIAPTLARVLGVRPVAGVQGRVLREALK